MVQAETLREVARVRHVRWTSGEDGVNLVLHQPELQSGQLESAWQLMHDRFLCRPERTGKPVRFAAADLTIHSQTGSLTLREVGAWVGQRDGMVEATMHCAAADGHREQPIKVTARRDRTSAVPTTTWRLDSGSNPLPCSALAGYLPVLGSLGNDAEFTGTMRWQSDSRNWWVDLTGSRFDNVSLDRLFEYQSHRLSGRATIQFDRCRIDPANRRSDMVGSIHAVDGRIGRSLLLSAQQHLAFDTQFPSGADDVQYDLIAIGFDVNNTQLKLEGLCHQQPSCQHLDRSAVVCADGLAIARSTAGELDALSVVNAIAPSYSIMVPLSDQTNWLSQLFLPPDRPMPSGAPKLRVAEQRDGATTIQQPGGRL